MLLESRVKLQNVLNVSNQYPQCETHAELLTDLNKKVNDKEAKMTQKVMNESKIVLKILYLENLRPCKCKNSNIWAGSRDKLSF